MKTELLPMGAYAQNKARRIGPVGEIPAGGKLDPKKLLGKDAVPSPDYKLDLSSKPLAEAAPSSPTLTLPSLPDVPTPPTPKLPDLPSVSKEIVKDSATKEIKAKVVEEIIKDGSVKKPAILFIKGLDVFSSPSKSERGYAGVGKMADAIEGSKVFSWNDEDKILEEIRKTHPEYPVILVGHSLGGDTAIEIADALDSLEHKFRPIDLLVTMDAVGFNHDIIPQNVKKHLNVFGEKNVVLNDGPHVARRHEKTDVKNILSPEDHIDIDDSKEIQYEVVSLIQKALGPGLA